MQNHDESWALFTDLYELTMAQGYWAQGMADRRAVFHLYARRAPYGGQAFITAGLETAIAWLESFRFSESDLDYLRSIPALDGTPLFREEFLRWMGEQPFVCDIEAIAEGSVVVPPSPVMRVTGPLWQAQVIESALLTVLNFQSLIATSAARTVHAAQGGEVLEFGLRRAQGVDGAMSASRAAYIGGVVGTSNVLAGKRWGIPLKGTHAHSWVVAFGDELAAFRAYAKELPDPTILLVDTWDTLEGVRNAITVAQELAAQGRRLHGIRLDSGDLSALSKAAREMLDAAGLSAVRIVASNDLDEWRVKELTDDGAPIRVWGIGTRLVTGGSQSAMGGVYKLSALEDQHGDIQYVVKRSEERVKSSYPGVLQVWRVTDEAGRRYDILSDINQTSEAPTQVVDLDGKEETIAIVDAEPLLQPLFRDGKRVASVDTLEIVRERSIRQWNDAVSTPIAARMDAKLWQLREAMLAADKNPGENDV